MNDEYDENDLQAQQHADTKRRTDQLLERHKQRIQKLKVTTEETEGLKEKIRAKLEEHKNLMESSNNNNNSSSNENDYSQDYNDDIYDDDEYSNINQWMNSKAIQSLVVLSPILPLMFFVGQIDHSQDRRLEDFLKNSCSVTPDKSVVFVRGDGITSE